MGGYGVRLDRVLIAPLKFLIWAESAGAGATSMMALGAHFACGLDFKTPSNRDIWWRSLK